MTSEHMQDISAHCYHVCDLAMREGFEKESLLKAFGIAWDKLEEAEDRNEFMAEVTMQMLKRSMKKLERLEASGEFKF